MTESNRKTEISREIFDTIGGERIRQGDFNKYFCHSKKFACTVVFSVI